MEIKKVYLTLQCLKENDKKERLIEEPKSVVLNFVDEPLKVSREYILQQYDKMCEQLKAELKEWLENE